MTDKANKLTGRPSSYTQAIGDEICERLCNGESLRAICLPDDMPSRSAVFRWLGDDGNLSFRNQYTRAREEQADTIFDECLQIADDATNDYMDRQTSDGTTGDKVLNGEHIQRSRLRIDTRKWMAGKMRPKKYGEKLELEHSGKLDTRWTVEVVNPSKGDD